MDLPVTVSCPGTGLTANTVSSSSPANSPSHFQSNIIRQEKYLEMEIEVEKEMELMQNKQKENEKEKEDVIEEEKEKEEERKREVEKEKQKEKDDDETILTILKFLLLKTRTAILIEGKQRCSFFQIFHLIVYIFYLVYYIAYLILTLMSD